MKNAIIKTTAIMLLVSILLLGCNKNKDYVSPFERVTEPDYAEMTTNIYINETLDYAVEYPFYFTDSTELPDKSGMSFTNDTAFLNIKAIKNDGNKSIDELSNEYTEKLKSEKRLMNIYKTDKGFTYYYKYDDEQTAAHIVLTGGGWLYEVEVSCPTYAISTLTEYVLVIRSTLTPSYSTTTGAKGPMDALEICYKQAGLSGYEKVSATSHKGYGYMAVGDLYLNYDATGAYKEGDVYYYIKHYKVVDSEENKKVPSTINWYTIRKNTDKAVTDTSSN